MTYAIIKSGGKQYKVAEGDTIEVQKLSSKNGKIEFGEVLLLVSDKNIKVGNPTVSKAKVTGSIVESRKGKKIRVAKFKSKVRYRRVTGFRPQISIVKIEKIQS